MNFDHILLWIHTIRKRQVQFSKPCSYWENVPENLWWSLSSTGL